MSDLERTNLEAHVDLCAERYKQLYTHLEAMDLRLTKLESVVEEIRDLVADQNNKTINRYLTWAGSIIAGLCAVIGFLAHKVFL